MLNKLVKLYHLIFFILCIQLSSYFCFLLFCFSSFYYFLYSGFCYYFSVRLNVFYFVNIFWVFLSIFLLSSLELILLPNVTFSVLHVFSIFLWFDLDFFVWSIFYFPYFKLNAHVILYLFIVVSYLVWIFILFNRIHFCCLLLVVFISHLSSTPFFLYFTYILWCFCPEIVICFITFSTLSTFLPI